MASLQTIPQSRYEAAELDGANTGAKFWYIIILPSLKPTVIFALFTTAIFILRSFVASMYIITSGRTLNKNNILDYYIYELAFARFEFRYAAACILFCIAFVFLYNKISKWL